MQSWKTTPSLIKIPQMMTSLWQVTRTSQICYQRTSMTRLSLSWRTRPPTLVCIPNHSVPVNHSFLENGAGGIRYMSAPPTTTPSADTTRKEEIRQVKFQHPGKVKQLLALLRTHQAGPSKHPWEEDTSNGDPQHRAKRVKTSLFTATQKSPAAQKQQ